MKIITLIFLAASVSTQNCTEKNVKLQLDEAKVLYNDMFSYDLNHNKQSGDFTIKRPIRTGEHVMLLYGIYHGEYRGAYKTNFDARSGTVLCRPDYTGQSVTMKQLTFQLLQFEDSVCPIPEQEHEDIPTETTGVLCTDVDLGEQFYVQILVTYFQSASRWFDVGIFLLNGTEAGESSPAKYCPCEGQVFE